MKCFVYLTLLIASLVADNVSASEYSLKRCSSEESRQAEAEAPLLSNWRDVYASFKQFSSCDDGAIAEGYSDTVGRLLANNWNEVSQLNQMTSSDVKFRSFILYHIDGTLPKSELQTIIKNARDDCKANAVGLCKLIGSQALTQIQEAKGGLKYQ